VTASCGNFGGLSITGDAPSPAQAAALRHVDVIAYDEKATALLSMAAFKRAGLASIPTVKQ